MKATLISAAVFVAAWAIAWIAFIDPMLRRYARTTGLDERIAAAESLPKKVALWLEAKKTLAVTFLMSLVAAAKGTLDTAAATVGSLQGADIAPLQDKGIWGAFFSDIVSLHILAGLGLLAAFLTLRGKVQAAQLPPKA